MNEGKELEGREVFNIHVGIPFFFRFLLLF